MFSGPTLPPNEPTWKSSGPCPSCAAKDAVIALLREAVQLALTVGTAYPPDSKARMDTHTQEVLEAVLRRTKG